MSGSGGPRGEATLAEARRAKARVMAAVGDQPAVTGVGLAPVGDGYEVKVNLAHAPPPGLGIPDAVGRVRVRVEVVGRIARR